MKKHFVHLQTAMETLVKKCFFFKISKTIFFSHVSAWGIFMQGNGEENQGKVATRKIVLALPAYCPQKLPTVVDLKEPMRMNKEAYNNIKIGHDLQSSGNEIGTGNTTTNHGKRTSIKHEEVQKVSPYFWNDYGKKGVSDLNNLFGNAYKRRNNFCLSENSYGETSEK